MKRLVLGGTRSGKSHHAESLATESGLEVVLLATAQPRDQEMADRISRHRSTRPSAWAVIEEPLALAATLREATSPRRYVIVDCLTLWLANLYECAERDRNAHIKALCEALPGLPGTVLLVSNEIGLGIVPENALARAFRDTAGHLHQRVAALCDSVELVVAGVPLPVKGPRIHDADLALEVCIGGPGGGAIERVRLPLCRGHPPLAAMPPAFRERLVEEGVDLAALCEYRDGGERTLMELKTARGTLRIAFCRALWTDQAGEAERRRL